MYEPLFNYLQLFRAMSTEEMTEITRHATYRTIQEGETLLEEGRTARELFFICEGILKIVKQNTKGNNVTQFFLKENHFCTILNSFPQRSGGGRKHRSRLRWCRNSNQ